MRGHPLTEGALSSNTIANLVGRLLPGILTVAVVPFLLPLVGEEGYGVLGLYASFQIVFTTLEVGLTITATRQVARNRALDAGDGANRGVLRALEGFYWLAGAAIALVLALAAGLIAEQLNADTIGQSRVADALAVGGIAIALRWPIALYAGILDGLQLQVRRNIVTVGGAALRIVGALPYVAFVDSSIVGFMQWQAFAAVIELMAMGYSAWRALGGQPTKARFEMRILQDLWLFAAGLTAVGVLGAVLTQADRFVIGARLPLEDLGYYTIAMTAAGPLPLIAAAVAGAVLPRFAIHLARAEVAPLTRAYGLAFDVTAYIALWGALPLMFFSHEILYLWTRSEEVANATDAVLTLLSLAYLLNALYVIPYTLVLAVGRTKIPLLVNGLSVPIVVGVTYALVPSTGLVGAAAIWLTVMAAHLVVYGSWAHRFLLPGHVKASFARSGLYAISGLVLFAVARLAAEWVPGEASKYAIVVVAILLSSMIGIHLLPIHLRRAIVGMDTQPHGGDRGVDERAGGIPQDAIDAKPQS